ncbi:MAG: hypothetical protein ACOCTG_00335 [Bacteroidota bacterium]
MADWKSTDQELPYPKDEVSVRVNGSVRRAYYRMYDRWYALIDLDRWKMRTSPYWEEDRSWYLRTDDIEAWRPESGEQATGSGNGLSG